MFVEIVSGAERPNNRRRQRIAKWNSMFLPIDVAGKV
ncbi:MAG: hypothetical protein ACI87E_004790 [Mariniblastus sp.]|jgi:hypothetical protein